MPPGGFLEELQENARTLDRHGFVDRHIWGQLRLGAQPTPFDGERGEWITDETCACGAALDTMGRHRVAICR